MLAVVELGGELEAVQDAAGRVVGVADQDEVEIAQLIHARVAVRPGVGDQVVHLNGADGGALGVPEHRDVVAGQQLRQDRLMQRGDTGVQRVAEVERRLIRQAHERAELLGVVSPTKL